MLLSSCVMLIFNLFPCPSWKRVEKSSCVCGGEQDSHQPFEHIRVSISISTLSLTSELAILSTGSSHHILVIHMSTLYSFSISLIVSFLVTLQQSKIDLVQHLHTLLVYFRQSVPSKQQAIEFSKSLPFSCNPQIYSFSFTIVCTLSHPHHKQINFHNSGEVASAASTHQSFKPSLFVTPVLTLIACIGITSNPFATNITKI